MDMDWRFDRRDGLYKLLDFNPRMGAQFRMFVDGQGVDVVRALHLDMTGRRVPRGKPRNGRKFMVENYDVIAAFGGYRRNGLTLQGWWRSLRGVEELGWFSSDDLLPTVVLAAYLAVAVCKRASRRAIMGLIRHGRKTHVEGGLAPAQVPKSSLGEGGSDLTKLGG